MQLITSIFTFHKQTPSSFHILNLNLNFSLHLFLLCLVIALLGNRAKTSWELSESENISNKDCKKRKEVFASITTDVWFMFSWRSLIINTSSSHYITTPHNQHIKSPSYRLIGLHQHPPIITSVITVEGWCMPPQGQLIITAAHQLMYPGGNFENTL